MWLIILKKIVVNSVEGFVVLNGHKSTPDAWVEDAVKNQWGRLGRLIWRRNFVSFAVSSLSPCPLPGAILTTSSRVEYEFIDQSESCRKLWPDPPVPLPLK